MVTERDIDIDKALLEVEIFAERVKVMTDDLSQGYFNHTVNDAEDYWKIAPPYYGTAGVKSNIADHICSDLLRSLKVLRELIENGNDSSDDETEGGEQE